MQEGSALADSTLKVFPLPVQSDDNGRCPGQEPHEAECGQGSVR